VFRFEESERDGVLVVVVAGVLDAASSPSMKAEVVRIAEAGRNRIVVDLSQLAIVDSTGVGVLISLYKRSRAQNGSVVFAGLKGQPREVFKLLRLGKTLELADTVEEAVSRVGAAAAAK
jgi:anti-sigma B factor antagonist